MSHTASAQPTIRRTFKGLALSAVIAATATTGVLLYQAESSSTPSFNDLLPADTGGAGTENALPATGETRAQSGGDGDGAVSAADGVLPNDVTVFSRTYPGVTKLDPDLLQALRTAADHADGVRFYVNSGWRSPEYQSQLLREAVSKYGSKEEAARWVATPESSVHVSGEAVDIGPAKAAGWLSTHGAAYGLCQIYKNEPWHFELRADAADEGCPKKYADPTEDPRLQ